MTRSTILVASLSALLLLRKLWTYSRSWKRLSKVAKAGERVLVLGAGTGIGRDVALKYYTRRAKVCVVGRRKDKLNQVVAACETKTRRKKAVLSVAADISSPDDMISLRELLDKEWGGLDTIILTAGVSALQPILGVAGVEDVETATKLDDIGKEGIEKAMSATEMATRINYYGPLLVALTFIPFLTRTSKSPSILLVSSMGALIPCPTRALYGSTKAASLVLYQALSIEHPSIAFSFVLPSTVAGSFRASAVDQGAVRESDPNLSGLKIDVVADRCIRAIDNGEKMVIMPLTMNVAPFLYALWPSLVDNFTRKKYRYHPLV